MRDLSHFSCCWWSTCHFFLVGGESTDQTDSYERLAVYQVTCSHDLTGSPSVPVHLVGNKKCPQEGCERLWLRGRWWYYRKSVCQFQEVWSPGSACSQTVSQWHSGLSPGHSITVCTSSLFFNVPFNRKTATIEDSNCKIFRTYQLSAVWRTQINGETLNASTFLLAFGCSLNNQLFTEHCLWVVHFTPLVCLTSKRL